MVVCRDVGLSSKLLGWRICTLSLVPLVITLHMTVFTNKYKDEGWVPSAYCLVDWSSSGFLLGNKRCIAVMVLSKSVSMSVL